MKLAIMGLSAIAWVLAVPALAQEAPEKAEAGDARVVDLTRDGPVITDQKAASPKVLTKQAEAEILRPMEPVIRDGDKAVLEPLVLNQEAMISSDDIDESTQAPLSSDDLNARALEAMQQAAPQSDDSGEDVSEVADDLDAAAEEVAAETALDNVADAQEVSSAIDDVEDEVAETETVIASEDGEESALTDPVDPVETAFEDAQDADEVMAETAIEKEDNAERAVADDEPTDLRARMAEADSLEPSETGEAVAEIEAAPDMITETGEDIAAAPAETVPEETSATLTMIKIGESTDDIEIEAGGRDVTTTVTPDGATRLIRIEPAEGQSGGATLITITKD